MMTKLVFLAMCGALTPSAALAQSPPAITAETSDGRMETFWKAAVLSPGPYVLAFGGAVIDEVSGFPEEWTGGEGFGKRNLARLAGGFASDAIGHTVGAIVRHRVLYEPCGCPGGLRRTMHALGRGFVTRTDSGRVVPHVSLLVAKAGAAGIATTWYPDTYDGPDIAREAVVGVGINALLNIAREFGPEMRGMIGLR